MTFESSRSTGSYFSPIGAAAPRSPVSFTANMNWALQRTEPTPLEKRSYIEGFGHGPTGYYWIGGGIVNVPGTGRYLQIGLGIPPSWGYGGGYTPSAGAPPRPSMSPALRWIWFIRTGR